jgi:hypothetical protein
MPMPILPNVTRTKNRCRIPKFADCSYATTDGLIANAQDVLHGVQCVCNPHLNRKIHISFMSYGKMLVPPNIFIAEIRGVSYTII